MVKAHAAVAADWTGNASRAPDTALIDAASRRCRHFAEVYRLEGTSFLIATKGKYWRCCYFGSAAEI
jgi:hypothetical protein